MSDVAQNGTQPQQEEFRIPDFIVSLIGRQQLEIESLRVQLQMFQMQQQGVPSPVEPVPTAPGA